MGSTGGWGEEVTVETIVSCRVGYTTQAPGSKKKREEKKKRKTRIQSDVRIVPTQQQADGQQLLPLLDFQGAGLLGAGI